MENAHYWWSPHRRHQAFEISYINNTCRANTQHHYSEAVFYSQIRQLINTAASLGWNQNGMTATKFTRALVFLCMDWLESLPLWTHQPTYC